MIFSIFTIGLLPISLAVLVFGLFRAKKLGTPKLSVAFIQLFLAIAAVGYWFMQRTEEYLAGPADGDVYAQTWGFQIMVFIIGYMPLILLVVGILIILESYVLSRKCQ
jgi:hypothetical protein